MCSRYSFNLSRLDLGFLGINDIVSCKPVQHVVPGQQVWLVRYNEQGAPELAQAKWGLVPSWLQDLSRAQINARVETAAESRMFRKAWQDRRCLILADSYYQWHMTQGNRRQLWRIGAKEGSLILMAGLWERFTVDSTLSFDSCAVLTMPAMSPLMMIAERMPALLTATHAQRWLSGEPFDIERFSASLASFPWHSRNILKG
ncbi:SOS response-associated peptidase [Endozoicomonas sp. SESOKO1]|uniref:SOS response-associated peptidase n=1 Tax=Endozoicomonas sp. SESOKO1 TaxID=2828742 RepID=UPI0021486456|nr:SOS response-associated peptidase [Endozoicomonas sp. SESOKO1]